MLSDARGTDRAAATSSTASLTSLPRPHSMCTRRGINNQCTHAQNSGRYVNASMNMFAL